MRFTETTRIEEGFGAVYEQRVQPALARLEEERRARLGKAQRYAALPLGVAALFVLLALFRADGIEDKLLGSVLPAAFGGVIAWFLWRMQAHRWSGSVAEAVMPAVCDFVGEMAYDREARERFPLDRLQALGMVGSFDRTNLADRLEGRYRDAPFELVEAHLTRTSSGGSDGDSKTTTVFDGILFRVGVPKPAPTRILIARDYGGMGNRLAGLFTRGQGRGMSRVEMDHARFEAAFEVHADDPTAARDYLPPAFLDNLLAIGESEGGRKGLKGMRAGFQGDSFYLGLEREGDFLAMGSLTTPVDAIEDDLHSVFEDIALVRRIIDRLHGDAPTV